MTSNLPEIVFLDLEASSLDADSWPIEIGVPWIDETSALYTSLTRRRAPHRAGLDSRRLARAWLRGMEAETRDAPQGG